VFDMLKLLINLYSIIIEHLLKKVNIREQNQFLFGARNWNEVISFILQK